jgi:hypothetical protein
MNAMGLWLPGLMSVVATTFLHEADAQQLNGTYNVGVMIAEPFTCRQATPCWRSGMQEYTRDGCPNNGIKTVGGECVHGYFPDLLNIIRDRTGSKLQVTVISGGGYNKVIAEASQPGSQKGDWPNGLCSGSPCDFVASDFSMTSDRSSIFRAEFSKKVRDSSLRLYMRYEDPTWLQAGSKAFHPLDGSLWAALILLLLSAAIFSIALENRRMRQKVFYNWSGLWKYQVDKIMDISKDRLGRDMVQVRWKGYVEGDTDVWKVLKKDDSWLQKKMGEQYEKANKNRKEITDLEKEKKELEEEKKKVNNITPSMNGESNKPAVDDIDTKLEDILMTMEELEHFVELDEKLKTKLEEVSNPSFRAPRTFDNKSEHIGEMNPGDAVYGSFLQLFFLNDSGEYVTFEGRIFVFFVCALVLLIVSCYTASVANFFTATSATLLMNGITFDKPEAQNDMGKAVSASPSGSFVISKGGANELFVFNNLKVNTKCRKEDKTCTYVKGYNDDYVGKSDLETARQVFLDKDVTAWIEDENQFEYYQSVFDYEAEEKTRKSGSEQKSLQCDEKWTYVSGKFFSISLGWVYGPSMQQTMKQTVNNILQDMVENKQMDTLWNVWVNQSDPCLEDRTIVNAKLSFFDFWVLFAWVGIIGVFLLILQVAQDFTGLEYTFAFDLLKKHPQTKRRPACSTHDIVKEQYKQWSKIEESKIQEDKNVKSRSRKLDASVTPALPEAEKVTPATSRLEARLIFTPPPLMGYPQPYLRYG